MTRHILVLIACLTLAAPARAGFSSSGVALQLNDVQLGGGPVTLIPTIPGKSLDDSAAIVGVVSSNSAAVAASDVLPGIPQAFLGAGPAPPEDTFVFTPTAPGTFARG